MTTYIQEMQRELEDLRAYKVRREREDAIEKRRRTAVSRNGGDTHSVGQWMYGRAAKSAGYVWEKTGTYDPGGPWKSWDVGVYRRCGAEPNSVEELLRHTPEKDKCALAAWLVGYRYMAFDGSNEFMKGWNDGVPAAEIRHLLPA